jgi:hypothetical protein
LIISLIPKEAIPEMIGLVREKIEPAIERSGGRMDWNEVLAELGVGRTTLWGVAPDGAEGPEDIEGFAVIRVVKYPQKTVLCVELLGGVGFVDGWGEEFTEVVNNWAKEFGCSHIEAIGRKGWRKVLDRLGFSEIAVTYEREVK